MVGRKLNKLTVLAIKAATAPGYFSDGGGLYLRVSKTGSKSWTLIHTRGGRTREMGLGPFPEVMTAQARELAQQARQLLRDGEDPIERRQTERDAARLADAKRVTFKDAAQAYIEQHRAEWKNSKHAQQWENTLAQYAYPKIGALHVADVDTGLVMKVLTPIWKDKTETASRVRGRIESVLDWARTMGHRTGDNPARWRGHLKNLLAERQKIAKAVHYPALPFTELASFMVDLKASEGIAAVALEFTILTACRTSEALLAQWSEVDLAERVWTVPAAHMKAGKEHRVPLAPRAVQVLRRMEQMRSNEYVFPGARVNRPLSNMAMLVLLRRMGRGDSTVHGFRSTFRDWASERTSFPREVIEMALAHAIGDKVEAAYRRGDLFDKRRKLMEQWATYCQAAPVTVKNVVPIKGARAN